MQIIAVGLASSDWHSLDAGHPFWTQAIPGFDATQTDASQGPAFCCRFSLTPAFWHARFDMQNHGSDIWTLAVVVLNSAILPTDVAMNVIAFGLVTSSVEHSTFMGWAASSVERGPFMGWAASSTKCSLFMGWATSLTKRPLLLRLCLAEHNLSLGWAVFGQAMPCTNFLIAYKTPPKFSKFRAWLWWILEHFG